MAKLYYHHVGLEGSLDFEKTVFRDVPLETVTSALVPPDTEVVSSLERIFPSGWCNCWGVPTGASFVMRDLAEGDYVLLLRSTTMGGDIPALCRVSLFLRSPQPSLSSALWGSPRFPYVFFFLTEPLSLLWADFIEHVGYSPRFQPHGLFSAVNEERLWRYHGVEGYILELHAKYTARDPSLPLRFMRPADLETQGQGGEPNALQRSEHSPGWVSQAGARRVVEPMRSVPQRGAMPSDAPPNMPTGASRARGALRADAATWPGALDEQGPVADAEERTA